MPESYSDPHAIPERLAGRLMLVITVELALLLGGTYGAWRLASGQGLGVKARPSPMHDFDDPIGFPPVPPPDPSKAQERLSVHFDTRASFDLRLVAGVEANASVLGKLTSGPSRTTIRMDGETQVLGMGLGRWLENPERPGLSAIPDRRWIQAWEYDNKVRVTQDVSLVTNNGGEDADSVLVRYLIENRGQQAHTVGLRFLLDTHVGNTDGVPFAVPGTQGMLGQSQVFEQDAIPCLVQALERENLASPGHVATLTLRFRDFLTLGDHRVKVEPVNRLALVGMPQGADWAVDLQDFQGKDSCAALFWEERRLPEGTARVAGFLYGLGKLATDDGRGEARLALSYGPRPQPGTDFDIIAWVKDPTVGKSVRIDLPRGFRLAQPETQTVDVRFERDGLWPVSWRVKVDPKAVAGEQNVAVFSGSTRVTMPVVVGQAEEE